MFHTFLFSLTCQAARTSYAQPHRTDIRIHTGHTQRPSTRARRTLSRDSIYMYRSQQFAVGPLQHTVLDHSRQSCSGSGAVGCGGKRELRGGGAVGGEVAAGEEMQGEERPVSSVLANGNEQVSPPLAATRETRLRCGAAAAAEE